MPDSDYSATGMFQFTHPVRGATPAVASTHPLTHVSIHAPREGCDLKSSERSVTIIVSIHAPREGCDIVLLWALSNYLSFNSRTP